MLDGLKVIEMATYIAAPGAGALLKEWGADVVKVEPLAGCAMRHFFGAAKNVEGLGNPVFDMDNRGKKMLSLDIATTEGVEVMHRLLKDADVFITNVRPSSLDRAGLNWEELHKAYPGLIYASLTGYGLDGEEKDRPGFDVAAFWCRSGMAHATTPKGSDPVQIRTGVGDHTTGIALAAGILAAYIEKQKTGEGRLVETSLLRTGIYTLGSDISIQQRMGRLASHKPRPEAVDPFYNFYRTADDKWMALLVRQGIKDDRKLLETIGLGHLADDEKFTRKGRRAYNKEVIEELDKAFAAKTLEEWGRLFDDQDLVWAPVQSVSDVVNDPQAASAGAFIDVQMKDGTLKPSVAGPVRFHGIDQDVLPEAGILGEDNTTILVDLGYSEAEIEALKANGAIGQG